MAQICFEFNGINKVYVAARENNRQTVVFDVKNGRGVFVFMMFFSDDDESKDQLFLYLARTARMIERKMYGRHEINKPHLNKFQVYLTDQHQQYIIEELGLEGRGDDFDFNAFLRALNEDIPEQLSLADLQENCQNHRDAFACPELRRVVDEAHKIYLIGPRQLPEGKQPREKTLRKLYLHIKADAGVLEHFIKKLKSLNKTLAWTDNVEFANGNIRQILNAL